MPMRWDMRTSNLVFSGSIEIRTPMGPYFIYYTAIVWSFVSTALERNLRSDSLIWLKGILICWQSVHLTFSKIRLYWNTFNLKTVQQTKTSSLSTVEKCKNDQLTESMKTLPPPPLIHDVQLERILLVLSAAGYLSACCGQFFCLFLFLMSGIRCANIPTFFLFGPMASFFYIKAPHVDLCSSQVLPNPLQFLMRMKEQILSLLHAYSKSHNALQCSSFASWSALCLCSSSQHLRHRCSPEKTTTKHYNMICPSFHLW